MHPCVITTSACLYTEVHIYIMHPCVITAGFQWRASTDFQNRLFTSFYLLKMDLLRRPKGFFALVSEATPPGWVISGS